MPLYISVQRLIGGKASSKKEDKAKAGSFCCTKSNGGGRPSKILLLPKALELKVQCLNKRAIAVQLNVGAATISQWIAK